jgi:proton translocating ATP synthase F1 alpha subunit
MRLNILNYGFKQFFNISEIFSTSEETFNNKPLEAEIKPLSEIFSKFLLNSGADRDFLEDGIVASVGDGIAAIIGLENVKAGELVEFHNPLGNLKGMALNLGKEIVLAVIFGNDRDVVQGGIVSRTKGIVSVPVGMKMLGKVVDALGNTVDGTQNESTLLKLVDIKAPGIIPRESVKEPMQTGILAVDSMIPIGRGQRELIIGDRQTGKTAIAIDTIMNQQDTSNSSDKVYCVYVAVSQKRSTVATVVERLRKEKALELTVIVAATASDAASLQFIAPYSGCAIGE